MAPLRKHFLALVLLLIGFCQLAPAGVAQDDLIIASDSGNIAQAKSLIAAKADVDAKRGNGVTALMAASSKAYR